MKKFFSPTGILLACFLYTGAGSFAQGADVDTMIRKDMVIFTPDTLVDLNKQLGGVKEITLAKGMILPEAITLTPAGLVILKSDGLLKADAYNFEVRATTPKEEVFITSVKIRRNGEKIVVTTVSDKIDMATGFRQEGKIYVVVAVSLILFGVLVSYLIFLDRRMRRLGAKLENRPH